MIFEQFPEFWNKALPMVGFKHLQQEMYLANLWFAWQLPLSLLKTAQGHPMLIFLSLVCSQLEIISCPRQHWGRTLRQRCSPWLDTNLNSARVQCQKAIMPRGRRQRVSMASVCGEFVGQCSLIDSNVWGMSSNGVPLFQATRILFLHLCLPLLKLQL